MKKITINNNGVFETETWQLTPYGIQRRRAILQTKIMSRKRKIQDKQLKINRLEKEIIALEEQLKTLNSPIVEAILQKHAQEQKEIEAKSQEILRELVGEELYQQLQTRKSLIFTAKDNLTYKIKRNGKIYRRVGKEWEQLCIVRPQELPLPDFITSLFFCVKENPTNYKLRYRRW
jgi:polyhydroxyalkanoate synthesis regulator phasin